MAKNKTSFSSENQPKNRRGKSGKTKVIEALARAGESEESFYDLLVEKALSGDGAIEFAEIMKRVNPIPKAVAPEIEFDFDPEGSPTKQASQILSGIASGLVPPDLGNSLIVSIRSMLEIEELTELKARLEKIEKELGLET